MINLNQKVEICWNKINKKHYESLGYIFTKYKDNFLVQIDDLTKGSHEEIELICDYCNKPFNQKYYSYTNKKGKEIIDKDACKNCRTLKIKESNLSQYGRESPKLSKETMKKRSNKKKIKFEQIIKEFEDINFTLLASEQDYIHSNIPMTCICNNHPNIVQHKSRTLAKNKHGCILCENESRIGDGSYSWKGGITPLHNHLRRRIKQWKIDSIKSCNYKCIFTGNRFDVVHHLYSFDLILVELINELKVDINFRIVEINDIEESKLKEIEDKCIELHYKHGLGICLSKPIHDLFHSKELYGRGNNTPEQFQEFQQRYNKGEFTSLLSTNNYKQCTSL
jgi:hypothetical protein